MRILGVNEWSHDTGIAVVEDGEIVCAAEEERFNREKHSLGFSRAGGPPVLSTKWVIDSLGLKGIEDFDFVALPWDINLSKWLANLHGELSIYNKANPQGMGATAKRYFDVTHQYNDRSKYLNFLRSKATLIPVDHHLSHASVAYRTSAFDKALIFIIDGAGETVSTSIFIGEGNSIKKIKEYPLLQSIGRMYSAVTSLVGFGEFQEGKTMALADYGEPLNIDPFISYDIDNDKFVLNFDSLIQNRKQH